MKNWDIFLSMVVKKLKKDSLERLKLAQEEGEKIIKQAYTSTLNDVISEYTYKIREIRKNEAKVKALLDVEHKRKILTLREEIISSVFESALKRIKEMPRNNEYKEIIKTLIIEAVENIGGKSFVVATSKNDIEICRQAIKEIMAERPDLTLRLSEEHVNTVGGVIVADPQGQIKYYNTFETRLEKTKNQIRRKISKMLFGGY
ncbi:MAG: hypothetical protein DRJ47_05490 [Thermoprotei archaeon]|nr:MAG: hypothetical protein DRJ47_05490 [Thermoprotei archaeon]